MDVWTKVPKACLSEDWDLCSVISNNLMGTYFSRLKTVPKTRK
jgi:hypothetical protein